MTDRERAERGFDASLARSLRGASREGTREACPDPNILAAYAERALSPDELAGWEAHFASCGRCQVQLAGLTRALDQAEPDTRAEARPAAALPWRWDWRWAAPLATAAVVTLAVWVIEPGSLRERDTTPATPVELDRMADEAPSDPDRAEGLRARREAAAAGPTSAAEPAPGEAAAEADALALEAPAQVEQRQNAVAVTEARDEAKPLLPDERSAAAVQAPPTVPSRADAQLREPAEPTAAARQRPAEAAVGQVAAATVLVQTPNPSVQWRLASSGLVERSTDAGASWEAQAVDAGLEPLAGSAPSAAICWIAGRAGAIFRTTDGRTWDRVTAPEDVDFIGIDASDALTASVAAASGATYATSDGGRTWTPR